VKIVCSVRFDFHYKSIEAQPRIIHVQCIKPMFRSGTIVGVMLSGESRSALPTQFPAARDHCKKYRNLHFQIKTYLGFCKFTKIQNLFSVLI
jgi:hypothetical protein